MQRRQRSRRKAFMLWYLGGLDIRRASDPQWLGARVKDEALLLSTGMRTLRYIMTSKGQRPYPQRVGRNEPIFM